MIDPLAERKRPRNALLHSSTRLQLLAKDLNLLYTFYITLCCDQVTSVIHISEKEARFWLLVVNFNPLEIF